MLEKQQPTQKYDPAILWPCLSIALCVFHPLFIFAVFFSIYKYRRPWIKQIDQQLSIYKWWYFAFPVFAFIVGYLNVMPFVRDDLMMHVVAYKFSYDFRSIFAHSNPLPSFNFWIGFQMFAGLFHRLLGPEYSVRAVQAIGVILFYTSFFCALHKILKDNPEKWLWCTIIFTLCVSSMGRVFLGRPDIFFTAWLMSAIFLRPSIWLFLGFVTLPVYSLSIIYAPAALLLNTSWRNKIIYGTLYGIGCAVFWIIYSEGEWLKIPQLLNIWNNNRIMPISELRGSLTSLEDIYLVALILLLGYFLSQTSFKLTTRAIACCLLIIYFLLPNYVRYMVTVVPLLGMLCAISIPNHIKFTPKISLIILIFASLIASKAVPRITTYDKVPKFKLPPNAVLLSQFNDGGLYSGILHNPQAKFAPAMEIGATDKTIQKIILNLNRGEPFDCQELKNFSFTHIQENSLKTPLPCLKLSQIDGDWRLWEIK